MSLNFLLELGVEEIPAAFLPDARKQLRDVSGKILEEAGATFESIEVHGSPRRLALIISNMSKGSEAREEILKGPPVRAAFSEGKPTKAAEGFAKKAGIAVADLATEGEYVVARVTIPGRSVEAILTEALPKIVAGLSWPKSMRWNETGVKFVRPLRWMVALLNANGIPFSWGGITADRVTYARSKKDAIVIAGAVTYREILLANDVMVDSAMRQEIIRRGIKGIEISLGCDAILPEGEKTVEYLADLVEDPKVLLGDFDPSLADAPREVLVLTMWKHQKYLPLTKDGKLMPKFVLVANRCFGESPQFDANVIAGNRRVLSARLSDAHYFWEEDQKRPLFDRLKDLERVTFQKKIGSMRERVERIEKIAVHIAPAEEKVVRAVRLSKADLTTKMVFEFPELQGVIGRRLAEAQGETAEIAQALEEHYWPLGLDARLPSGLSAVIALADKAELLLSFFKAGFEPTGSADPYALRRAALGIIRILLAQESPLSVDKLLPDPKVQEFVRARALNYLAEEDRVNPAVMEAVAAVGWHDLSEMRRRARAAAKLPSRPDYGDLTISFKRVMNILDSDAKNVDSSLFVEEAERILYKRTAWLDKEVSDQLAAGNVDEALTAMASLRPDVDRFFDDVLVNVEDARLRENRKALLASLGSIFLRVIDFSKL